MDYRGAMLVRVVGRGERIADLIEEARGRTFVEMVEVAILRLEEIGRAMVQGGRDGITFDVGGDPDLETLRMDVAGRPIRVLRIYGHTHPRPTGPSDGDLEVLATLGQSRSYLFELGGDRDGTLIRPKRRGASA